MLKTEILILNELFQAVNLNEKQTKKSWGPIKRNTDEKVASLQAKKDWRCASAS